MLLTTSVFVNGVPSIEAGKHTRNRPGQIRATRSQGRPCLSTKLHHARMANWGVDGVHGAELSDTIYKISE
jgi:hypothetical protein